MTSRRSQTVITKTNVFQMTVAASLMVSVSFVGLFSSWAMSSIAALSSLNELVFHIATVTNTRGDLALIDPLISNVRQRASGEQKILVLLIKTTNDAPPYTVEEAERAIFGPAPSLADWMRTVSSGHAWVTGDVSRWYTIQDLHNAGQRNLSVDVQWGIIANAIRGEINFLEYERIILVNPNMTISNFPAHGGLIPGNPEITRDVVESALSLNYSLVHEVGHSLGTGNTDESFGYVLGHADAFGCSSGISMGNNCVSIPNQDAYDTMGAGRAGYFNAYYLDRLGWLSTEDGSGQYVTQSGNYNLAPLETTNGVRFLKIPADFDNAGNPTLFYYIEYRQPIGYDAAYPPTGEPSPSPFDGVLIHLSPIFVSNNSLLLDMNPTGGALGTSRWDGNPDPLHFGETFTDTIRGITIFLPEQGENPSTARVAIGIPQQPPAPDTSPSIRFLNLTNGQTVQGLVNINIDATDERGVRQISISGSTGITPVGSLIGEAVRNYTWNTNTIHVPDGEYTLTATAIDTSNRRGQATVRVNVLNTGADVNPPTVQIVRPAPGEILSGQVGLELWADDNRGAIRTSLSLGGFEIMPLPLGSGYSSIVEFPYFDSRDNHTLMFRWDTARRVYPGFVAEGVPNGNYFLRAYVVDRAGNIGYSDSMAIGVMNGQGGAVEISQNEFVRGDANFDGQLDNHDYQAILNSFSSGESEVICMDAADANDDGAINIVDVSVISNFLNLGNRVTPSYPFPLPGHDEINPFDIFGCQDVASSNTFLRGDTDGNGRLNINDPVRTLNWLFLGGPAPTCLDAADANDDGTVNIVDARYLLNYLYLGTAAPPPPGAITPGPDPTDDSLGCGD